MIEYLIIQLDDASTSFCHYDSSKTTRNLIGLDILKSGVLFAMKNNLMIQFVFPDYILPQEYKDVIESIDHSKIVSSLCEDELLKKEADVVVFNNWTDLSYGHFCNDKSYVLRTSKDNLFDRFTFLKSPISQISRLNIVITDVETFNDEDFVKYKQMLSTLSESLEKMFVEGKSPQLNILTDRMALNEMNNCGAGYSSISLMPDGKLYICPGFYYTNDNCVGNLEKGLDIKNKQLYRLDHAPLCRICDAYQCKRCIWLNKKTTLEVNTPSHEQCVVAHLERNASRELLQSIRQHGTFLTEQEEIKKIDYLDPFDKRDEWQ